MQTTSMPQMEAGWLNILRSEFSQKYMLQLKKFLKYELQLQKVIYPHGQEIFEAFNLTPFDKVKVVIIGQDPYHGPGQAHGLCFSVKPDVKVPPSLRNIYKELEADLGVKPPPHGHLKKWAEQGVLLLNTVLTVEKGQAGSHQGRGWEQFTDKVIETLNESKENLVFVLWGSPAQKKGAKINPNKHLIIKSPHPSPLSAHRGFFGCKPFSKINNFLERTGQFPIDWGIPETEMNSTILQ